MMKPQRQPAKPRQTLPAHASRPSDRLLFLRAQQAADDDAIEAHCSKHVTASRTLQALLNITRTRCTNALARLTGNGRPVRLGDLPHEYRYATPDLAEKAKRPAIEVPNIVPCKEWLQSAPITAVNETVNGRPVVITRAGPLPSRWDVKLPASGGAITADWLARRAQPQAAR